MEDFFPPQKKERIGFFLKNFEINFFAPFLAETLKLFFFLLIQILGSYKEGDNLSFVNVNQITGIWKLL